LSFERLLNLIRFKKVEQIKDGGLTMTISTSTPNQGGTNSQTKAEIEKERQAFLKDIFFAFKEMDKKRIASPKQKDLRPYIFNKYKDAEKKLSDTLIKHNLKFNNLWQKYLL
jgi:cytochrome c556